MAGRGLVAGVVGVLAGAAGSCNDGGGAFTCASSSECETSGAIGTCEPIGYCSFPDAECPSGQRFGEHAGGGFAGICVDPDTGGSGEDPSTSGPGSTSVGSTDPILTSSPGDTSSADGPGDDSTTAPDPGTTGGSTSECEGTIVADDFADGAIDGLWMQVLPRYLAEGAQGLELTVTLAAGDGYPQVRPTPSPWNLDGGYVRIHVSAPPTTTGEQLFVSAFNLGASVAFTVNGTQLVSSYDTDAAGSMTVDSRPFDPILHAWMQLRFEAGAVIWETSTDGVDFETLAMFDVDVAPTAMTVTITAGNYADLTEDRVVAVDGFEMCAQ